MLIRTPKEIRQAICRAALSVAELPPWWVSSPVAAAALLGWT